MKNKSRKKLSRKLKKIRYNMLHIPCVIIVSIISFVANTMLALQEWKWMYHDEITAHKNYMARSLVLFERDLVKFLKIAVVAGPILIVFMLAMIILSK